ncbi:MAG: hypothetical protein ACFFDS_09785 [Candidatus Thorarchaeota archaeon]
MGKQPLKRLARRVKKLSRIQIVFILLILSFIGFIISTTQIFTNSRSVSSSKSHAVSKEFGYGMGENISFMYHEIYIEVLYAIQTREYIDAGLPSDVGISVVLTDEDSNEIANEQLTLTAKRTYICETRSFNLKVDQFTEYNVVYIIKIKTYFYNPTQSILIIFFSFLLAWIIGMAVILQEKRVKMKERS